jgi:hypothetical protein
MKPLEWNVTDLMLARKRVPALKAKKHERKGREGFLFNTRLTGAQRNAKGNQI